MAAVNERCDTHICSPVHIDSACPQSNTLFTFWLVPRGTKRAATPPPPPPPPPPSLWDPAWLSRDSLSDSMSELVSEPVSEPASRSVSEDRQPIHHVWQLGKKVAPPAPGALCKLAGMRAATLS
jgi:hypothetical protein